MPVQLIRNIRDRQPLSVSRINSFYGKCSGVFASPSLYEVSTKTKLTKPAGLSVGIDSTFGPVLVSDASQPINAVSAPISVVTSEWTMVFTGVVSKDASVSYSSLLRTRGGGYEIELNTRYAGVDNLSIVLPTVANYPSGIPPIYGVPCVIVFCATNGTNYDVIFRRLDNKAVTISLGNSLGTPNSASGNFYIFSDTVAGYGQGANAKFSGFFYIPRRIRLVEAIEISANPWQIFEPETIPLFWSSVTAQFARPTSDASAGTWTASTGSDLYAMIDETVVSDADYITTVNASTCEVALGSLSDPASSSGHIVRYRLSANSGGVTVRLRQGTTTIASWTHSPAPASLTTYEQTLSGGEADSITDYTALKIQFEAI